MENASKAVIIAGSVIIVIMIISLSMYFYGQSTTIVDVFGNKINTTEVKNHNNSFLVYEGDLLGTEVINACIKIKEYNTNGRLPVEAVVQINGVDRSFGYADLSNYEYILNNVNRTRVFLGTVEYDDQGIVNKVRFMPK